MEGQRKKRAASSWSSTSRSDGDGNGGERKKMAMTCPSSSTNKINNPNNPSDEEVEEFFAILRRIKKSNASLLQNNHRSTEKPLWNPSFEWEDFATENRGLEAPIKGFPAPRKSTVDSGRAEDGDNLRGGNQQIGTVGDLDLNAVPLTDN
ncbi:hypothetical protein AMTR_s00079p00056210 [Amborella trichopoda]|uniref:Uncharacterized protein n=1 Tax=Amborella trichopoda TaxID=13333 RepID=W1P8E2_AMBTC|nr:hypothetical protein AMTR_s00079p00056210 [Amborella trichopoda]